MKTTIFFVLVANFLAVSLAFKVPVPNAPFITDNQELSEAEMKTKFVDYVHELNGFSKDELNEKNLEDIIHLAIASLSDRLEVQYKRAATFRKHIKYFLKHRNPLNLPDPLSPNFKPFLIRYLIALNGKVEQSLHSKGIPELIDLALKGLRRRLDVEDDPDVKELVKAHMGYFEDAKIQNSKNPIN